MEAKGFLMQVKYIGVAGLLTLLLSAIVVSPHDAFARDIEYKDSEVSIRVAPREPTQVQFPGTISGGFIRKQSTLALERKDSDLIIFANEGISEKGESLIIRLQDGRSYSVRIQRASQDAPRDDVVRVLDDRRGRIAASDEEELDHQDRNFPYAPPTQVSGLMREMILATEFGKANITGYRVSDRYKGQPVLDDGTINATIEKIFIGPNLWGYVIDAKNKMDHSQRINPATFRLDGTRAISIQNWELAPRPMNVEQQIAGKDSTKVYIITKAIK